MGAHSNQLIREADASAIDNADQVWRLREELVVARLALGVQSNRVNRLEKELAGARTRLKRFDRRSSRPNRLACLDHVAGLHLYGDEDAPNPAA